MLPARLINGLRKGYFPLNFWDDCGKVSFQKLICSEQQLFEISIYIVYFLLIHLKKADHNYALSETPGSETVEEVIYNRSDSVSRSLFRKGLQYMK